MLLGGGGASPLIACWVNFFGDGMVEIFLSPIFDVGPRGFKNSESCNIFCENNPTRSSTKLYSDLINIITKTGH